MVTYDIVDAWGEELWTAKYIGLDPSFSGRAIRNEILANHLAGNKSHPPEHYLEVVGTLREDFSEIKGDTRQKLLELGQNFRPLYKSGASLTDALFRGEVNCHAMTLLSMMILEEAAPDEFPNYYIGRCVSRDTGHIFLRKKVQPDEGPPKYINFDFGEPYPDEIYKNQFGSSPATKPKEELLYLQFQNPSRKNFDNGEYQKALQLSEAALVQQPKSLAWDLKGLSLIRMGRLEEAMQAYNRAIELTPENPQIWYGRGHVFHRSGDYKEALWNYNKTLWLDPNHTGAWEGKKIIFHEWGYLSE